MTKAIQTQTALAVAFMADRLNEGYIRETRRFSEDVPTQFANKEIVKFYFTESDNFTPEDFVKAIPTDDDFDNVDLALKHFKRYTLELLGNTLSDFQKQVFNSIQGPTVHKGTLGLVSYVPELIRRELQDAKLKKMLRTEYRESIALGKYGEKCTGNLKIIDARWSKNWESYNYTADFGGNIVSFMNKEKLDIGQRINFKAKIKAHQRNKFFDIPETRLNYMRKMKDAR